MNPMYRYSLHCSHYFEIQLFFKIKHFEFPILVNKWYGRNYISLYNLYFNHLFIYFYTVANLGTFWPFSIKCPFGHPFFLPVLPLSTLLRVCARIPVSIPKADWEKIFKKCIPQHPIFGVPSASHFWDAEGPRTNGNLYTVSRLLAQVARLLAPNAS